MWLAITIPLWVVSAHLRRVGPENNALTATLCWFNWLYCKWIHHASYEGLELIPKTNNPGGLIVVSNHRSPIDPMLLQAICPFKIRWMMAKDSMTPNLDWMWKLQKQIPVDRDGKDSSSLRISIRHVQAGGVLGIFPEGAISKPGGAVKPFFNGIGLGICRARRLGRSGLRQPNGGARFRGRYWRGLQGGLVRLDKAVIPPDDGRGAAPSSRRWNV